MKRKLIGFFLIGFGLAGCAKVKSISDGVQEGLGIEQSPLQKAFASELVSTVPSKWFRQPKRFSLESDDINTPKHFFFDINPDINMSERTLSFVVETPEDSSFRYNIDIFSGQHYLNNRYCSNKDASDRYDSSIKKPPFTIGVLPRVFDQLGTPQKIFVFGDADYYKKFYKDNFFDARVVGGYIEQYCPRGACLSRNQWKSRIVLFGIQTGYTKFDHIQTISQLKKEVDWPYIRAFIENGQGQNKVGNKYYPAYKMGALIDSYSAMDLLRNKSIFFTVKKLTKMRNSCYALYDKTWEELGSDSELERQLRVEESMLKRAKLETKAQKSKTALFHKRFLKHFKKYHRELKTCMKYIYYGNHHIDSERFWFFTYYKAFLMAHDAGFTYDCDRGTWVRNPLVKSGRRAVSLKKEFKKCSGRRIDQSFDHAIFLLRSLSGKNLKSYRFIDYDRGGRGTHNKMYSWVDVPVQRYECSQMNEHYLTFPTFVKDKRWRPRHIKNKTTGQLKY